MTIEAAPEHPNSRYEFRTAGTDHKGEEILRTSLGLALASVALVIATLASATIDQFVQQALALHQENRAAEA